MADMLQFWTVGVAGRMNNLMERYYSYEDAHDAAVKKAQNDPTNIYLVLKLEGYAEGEITVNVNSEALEENIILPRNQYSIVGVTFTYNDGSFMDLTDCEIELLVLLSRTSPESEAIYDVVVDGFSGMKEVEYNFDPEITADELNGWYKIKVIKDGVSKTYQEGVFLII